VKRLGDGNYLFGTKKVFAKILNGKIIIKVGGGFMSIDEFMQTYQDFEVQKVQQMLEKGMFNMNEYENQNFIEAASPNSKLFFFSNLVLERGKRGGSGSPNRQTSSMNI
jgi:hypothetical protein